MKTIIFTIAIGVFFVGCNPQRFTAQDPKVQNNESDSVIRSTASMYQTLMRGTFERGWPTDVSCDALLYSSIYNWATRTSLIPISLAMGEPGQWFRTPDHKCYDDGRSGSDISRDQILGRMLLAAATKDERFFEQIIDYGEDHKKYIAGIPSWEMGRGAFGAVMFGYRFQASIYEGRKRLTGEDHDLTRYPRPFVFSRGYEAQLTVLHLIYLHTIRGSLSKGQVELLYRFANEEPLNGLFNIVAYHFSGDDKYLKNFYRIMLDHNRFPRTGLPMGKNKCAPWLWEKSMADPWFSICPANERPRLKHVHTGMDYVVAASLYFEGIPTID